MRGRKSSRRWLWALLPVAALGIWWATSESRIDKLYDRMEADGVTVRRLSEDTESALILRKDGPHRRLLVFVHGWNGDAFETWGELIPALIRTDDLPESKRWLSEFDILTFGYDTGLGRKQSIDEVARELKSVFDLEVLRRDYASAHVLAHSMGGLVVQRYLLDELKTRDDDKLRELLGAIRSVVYFDSPHNGLHLADDSALKWLVRLERETVEMRRDSAFRRRLQADWDEVLDADAQGGAARQLLIDRAWILEAQHTREAVGVSGRQGIYGRFGEAGGGRRSHIRVVRGADHMSIAKSTEEEIARGEGAFMENVVPVLGRSEVIHRVTARPFGVTPSADGRWVFVVGSDPAEGGEVRRIDARTLRLDRSWRAPVGTNPHELAEVDLGEAGTIGISTDNGRPAMGADCPAREALPGVSCEPGLTFVRPDDGRPVARVVLGGDKSAEPAEPAEPDALAVRGTRVVVSDGGPASRVWVGDAATREFTSLADIGGTGWHLTGVAFVDDRRVVAAGYRGLGASEGLLALLEVAPESPPRVLDTVATLPLVSDVDYLDGPGLVAVASFRESTGVAFHRIEGDTLTARTGDDIPPTLCFRGARIADLRPVGDDRLLATGQDGAVRRLFRDTSDGEFRAEELFHGGRSSFAAVQVGERVFVTNGDDDSVGVLWAGDERWPPAPVCP